MEKKIGKNVSSGAEKVETVEKAAEKKQQKKGAKAPQKTAAPKKDRVAEQMAAAKQEETAAAEARYGVWAGELTDFVITEDTVLSADVQAEGDGYVLTFDLRVEGDDDAAFYYKKQMVTMGELDAEPAFTSVRLSVRIAADWTPLSVTTEESYSSKKMVTADCTGVTEVAFTYGEAAVDLSAYDSYFRAYA